MSRPIIGVDPSYTATGWADEHEHGLITTSPDDGDDLERCVYIAEMILMEIPRALDSLVVIEGGVNRSANGLRSGYLHGVIRYVLFNGGVAWLDVPPAVVKKYATGRGNAPKVDVVVAARDRLGYDGTDDNVADALWLRQIGLAVTGQPCVEVPKAHRAALDKLGEVQR